MGVTIAGDLPAGDGATRQAKRIAIIDDDDSYREALSLQLAVAGFVAVGFGRGEAALEFFSAGESVSVILLEWRTPAIDGSEVLRGLRERGVDAPVLVVTASADQSCEDAAFKCGAVDFIDKSRRLPIVLKRVQLIAGGRTGDNAGLGAPAGEGEGPLVLRPKDSCAWWKGQEVRLTRTEIAIVNMLAGQSGQDFTYRAIYDVVRGKGFVAGSGPDGHRTNVRSFIKRIRKKFRSVDPEFDCIKNYFGFGYRWSYEPSEATGGHAEESSRTAAPRPVPLSFNARRSPPFDTPRPDTVRSWQPKPALQPPGAGS